MHGFHTHALEIKYVQNEDNTCVLSSLYYYCFAVN